MKSKRVVIFVCTLIMFTAFSAVATTSKQEKSSGDQNTGHRGGLFTQLPMSPGFDTNDWYAIPSCFGLNGWQAYESFWDVTSPIRSIHWWGLSVINDSSGYPWPSGDPVGMTVNITFYEDDSGGPGNLVRSYNDIKPSITATGIIYPELENISLELYFFEYNLTPSCNLSNGWVSILSTGSDNDCYLCWMASMDGNKASRYTHGGMWDSFEFDFSLSLTDGNETGLEIKDIKSGFGVTLDIKNNGISPVDTAPVHFIVRGGKFQKIYVDAGETISGLASGETKSMKTGLFFGLGKITIFVVGDGIAAYKHGIHLFIYTIIQNS